MMKNTALLPLSALFSSLLCKGVTYLSFLIQPDFEEQTEHATNGQPIAIYRKTLEKRRGDNLPLHWHEEFQLVWVTEEAFAYQVEKERVQLHKGDLLFINSGRLHRAELLDERVSYVCIDFSARFLNEKLAADILTPLAEQTKIDQLLFTPGAGMPERMAKIEQEQDFAKLTLPLNLLILEAIETVQAVATGSASARDPVVQTLLDFVHQHYATALTVSLLSAQGHINKNKCTQLFKAYTGLSPANYILAYRLQRAKELLLHTERPVSEICYQVGFNHLSYFIERFKQRYGSTPLAFRKSFNRE
jgi:AraC-like DNA-binding protein/quercetin dioxygenase-like cupin family protein